VTVLLTGLNPDLCRALIERLTLQGDEPRVIEPDHRRASLYRSLGAHVAAGDGGDPELVEQAAQGARTIFAGAEKLDGVVEGAKAAGTGRLVVLAETAGPARPLLDVWPLDYVLIVHRRGWFRRKLSLEMVAEALDAGDDLAGHPRLVLDLDDPKARRALGITPG
jgi:hypothetical protein